MTANRCRFCAGTLEPAQELRYLVETYTLDDPTHLARIRHLPADATGAPLRVCEACQRALEVPPVRPRLAGHRPVDPHPVRGGMLTAFGVLSAGWFLSAVLTGPRA